MKIHFEPKNDCKDILTLFVNDEPWKDIHISIFGRKPKIPVQIDSLAEFKALFNELEYKGAKHFLLKRLSQQSYHSAQMEKLLHTRLVQSPTIQKLIADGKNWGYLNDETWLETFIQGHLKRYSMRMITLKLQSKGISKNTIKDALQQFDLPEQESRNVLQLLSTRYKTKNLQDFKQKQKVIASLLRKGYGFDSIHQALLSYKNQNSIE